MVKHAEYVKMERGCISLMYSMVIHFFRKFFILSFSANRLLPTFWIAESRTQSVGPSRFLQPIHSPGPMLPLIEHFPGWRRHPAGPSLRPIRWFHQDGTFLWWWARSCCNCRNMREDCSTMPTGCTQNARNFNQRHWNSRSGCNYSVERTWVGKLFF